MTFEEWYATRGSRFMSSETAMKSAWDAAVVNSKLIPEGYVLVPIEPTEAMVEAGLDANVAPHPEDIYKAMTQAAQEEE